jgi:hypothetical protein
MSVIKKVFMFSVVVFVATLTVIQFFGIDKTNPAVVNGETLAAAVNVPGNVRDILERSCRDCHTNTTLYPWYASIQPSGWFLKNHIDDGRSHLNFSVFNTYPGKRKIKKLEEVCEQADSKEMPLPSYLWIHRDATLKDGDSKILCDWVNTEKAKIQE